MVCVLVVDDVSGETIADYVEEVLAWNADIVTWNSVTDLRLHVGNIGPDAIRRMGHTLERALCGRRGGRAAVVSHNTGLRFLLNLARLFIPGHELRAFSDMETAYAWAVGQDAVSDDDPEYRELPSHMVPAGWGRPVAA